MKEIPFLQHLSPISLSGSGSSGSDSGNESQPSTSSSAPSLSSSTIINGAGIGNTTAPRCYTVATISSNGYNNNNDNVPHGAFGLILCEEKSFSTTTTSLAPIGTTLASDLASLHHPPTITNDDSDYNKLPSSSSSNDNENLITMDTSIEGQHLRGLTSVTYSHYDDSVICTNGIPGKYGWVRITTRDATAATTTRNMKDGNKKRGGYENDVFVDISLLLNNNNNHHDSGNSNDETSPPPPVHLLTIIVKTACFITHPNNNNNNNNEQQQQEDEEHVKGWSPTKTSYSSSTSLSSSFSWLHVHMMTSQGTLIRLVFSYPNLKPPTTVVVGSPNDDHQFVSFVYPPSHHLTTNTTNNSTSSRKMMIGYDQVCFPTPTTVVYTTTTNNTTTEDGSSTSNSGHGSSHLYCIDLGDSSSSSLSSIITRVWSTIHKEIVVPSPTDNSNYYNGNTTITTSTSKPTTGTTPAGIRKKSGGGEGMTNQQPSARKKARYSIGTVLSSMYTMVVGGGGGDSEWDDAAAGNEEYEYKDDDDVVTFGLLEENDTMNDMPSIVAVTSLHGTYYGSNVHYGGSHEDGVARVGTYHTDGSLRIWVAETTRRRRRQQQQQQQQRRYNMNDDDNHDAKKTASFYRPRLRIPSVQCIISSNPTVAAATTTTATTTTVPSPKSALEITLRGQYNLQDHSYQVILCSYYNYSSSTTTTTPQLSSHCPTTTTTTLRVFRGKSFSNFDEDDSIISFGNDTIQELALPTTTNGGGLLKGVVDVSWDSGIDLLVLFRQEEEEEEGSSSMDDHDKENDKKKKKKVALLAVYPLNTSDESGSSLYLDPVLPSNMTLKYLGMNHASSTLFNLSASEELDRFIDLSTVQGSSNNVDNDGDDDDDDDIEMDTTPPSSIDIAQLEARIDKAGLLAIFQPLGRSRPSTLAVHRAMFRLGLIVNQNVKMDDIHPTSIVLAMRNWKKRSEFEVPRDGSPLPSSSQRHGMDHHAKRHSNKSFPRVSDDEEEDIDSDTAIEIGQNLYRQKWIRLLSEIRREEVQLNDVLSISSVPVSSSSSSINILMRVGMVSLLSLDGGPMESTLSNEDEKLMAELDELSLDLIVAVMSDPDCRQMLNAAEALLYNAASKASPLVSGWSSNGKGNNLMVQIGNVASLAMTKMSLTEHQRHLLSSISKLDLSFAEKWLQSPTSLSSNVSNYLAITKTFDTMPNSSPEGEVACDADAQVSATALISSMVDSTRLLSLSRLIVVSGMPQSVPEHLHNNALRSVLYSTALSWATKQSSSYYKSRTVLDEYLAHEMTKAFYSSGVTTAMHLADMCIASSYSVLANESSDGVLLQLVVPSHEPRVALRLLAPLVEYPNFALLGNDQKRKEITAECLLAEAAVVAKHFDSDTTMTSPKELWSLASDFLSDSISLESLNTSKFNEIFECLRGNRVTWWTFEAEPHHKELLYQAMTVILQIGDDDGVDSSTPETEEEIQRLCTMQTVKSLFLPLALCSEGISVDQSFIDGNAWRNIPRISMYNFVKTLMKVSNLIHRVGTMERYLQLEDGGASLRLSCAVVLEAVNDAISSITSNLPPGMCREMPELSDLYSAAFQTSVRGRLWDEALESCISNPGEDGKHNNIKRLVLEMVRVGDVGKLVDMSLTVGGDSNDLFHFATKIVEEAALEQRLDLDSCLAYWGCLYTLQASRGNWRQAAEAMDLCGKVTVSNALSNPDPQTRAASKKIMDQASLSAHVCAHAVSLVETSSRQYIGEQRDSLLTKDDIDRRAVRASALRSLSMDECSPDSVSSILKSPSLDTIDILARMGYYEHAIAVAAGVSSKRKSNPSGVDILFDSLRHIMCTYLVPAALACSATGDEGNQLESRSKVIQMRVSSSVCEREIACRPAPSATNSFTANSQSWASGENMSTHSLQATMAMNLLYQYTTFYSKRCRGLGLSVASAVLELSKGNAVLPIWLKDLCMFGIPKNESNLFAQTGNGIRDITSSVANPSALVRLLMTHHKYGDACDVVTAILLSSRASRLNPSNRLPEKGSIDYVPYDLIDNLWHVIEVIASNSASESDEKQKKIQILLQRRTCMEKSLSQHFAALKLSEDGLRSARTLSNNA